MLKHGHHSVHRLLPRAPASPSLRSAAFSTASTRRAQIEMFINNRPVKVEQGVALIQACEAAGVDIPRFCYHERLAVAGNCRMCLVELERSPKPVASCAMPAMPGMRIHTDTPLVKKAREGVMEFLLANHPLDCPICDQGGECDLQDQSMRYGADRSRFAEVVGKRAVEDKNFGPLIKTEMTRCIQCTRCVRFANEVAGAPELGTSGRGNDMQIGTYIDKTIKSELSGNVIDLCPVGALTSKPFAFTARPWELRGVESVDVMDAVGCAIKVDSRGVEVMRVLPREHDAVNEEWISDKARFAYDGLKRQRLGTPMVRDEAGKLRAATWPEALEHVASAMNRIPADRWRGMAGALADAESMVALKDMFNGFGAEELTVDTCRQSTVPPNVDLRASYMSNSKIAGIDQADVLILIGTNPRHEAAVFNARIRKRWLDSDLEVAMIGPEGLDFTYDYTYLGQDMSAIDRLIKGDGDFASKLAKAAKPMIIVGSAVTERIDASALLSCISDFVSQHKDKFLSDGWNGFNVLQRDASRVAAFDIGYTAPATGLKPELIYMLNADGFIPEAIPQDSFVVYQGHHGDAGAHRADVILPGAAYTEKAATYVSTEGRSQSTRVAVPPPAAAREDWKIIRALSEVAGRALPYDDVETLRDRMEAISPTLAASNRVELSSFGDLAIQWMQQRGQSARTTNEPLQVPIQDFYMTDPISRASRTMAKCSAEWSHPEVAEEYIGDRALG